MHGNVERLPIPQEKVAVLLNGNARAVTEQLRRELEQFVPPEDLFFSRSFEDARSIARTVLDRGYGTVLTGGGDGTFVGYVNCIFDEVARGQPHLFVRANGGSAAPLAASHTFRLPRFGVLRLGTGNARGDRKSTRLNSSHLVISYAVFCLKKKKQSRAPNERPYRIDSP